MKQTLHILAKDARRSWSLVAVVVAMNAILAWLTPLWVPSYGNGTVNVNYTVDLLQVFLPVAWWCTIAHVIHGERLVGDRQFWITRPYSWKSLVAAKVLFCVVFLILPFLVSDCVILSATGFSPWGLIPALLWKQCKTAGVFMLPPFLLAALTRRLRQFLLVCFALLISFFVLIQLEPLHPSQTVVTALANPSRPASFVSEWGFPFLYVGGGLALLLWQYARRQTAIVRAIAIAIYACCVLLPAWPSKPIPPSTAQAQPSEFPDVSVFFAPSRGALRQAELSGTPDQIQVDIPIELSGRSRELLACELASIRLAPERGDTWASSWNWFTNIATRQGGDWMEFHLNPKAFQELNRGPVDLQAVLGVTVYERQTSATLRTRGEWTKVPGLGMVAVEGEPFSNYLWFRIPVQYPTQKFRWTIRVPDSAELYHGQWMGSYPPDSNIHISPVVSYAAVETNNWRVRLPQQFEGEFIVDRSESSAGICGFPPSG
jgi:hypothetical protein